MTDRTIYAALHIFGDEPTATFSPTTYPSVTFAADHRARATVSITGDREQRRAFAAALRAAADQIETWTREES